MVHLIPDNGDAVSCTWWHNVTRASSCVCERLETLTSSSDDVEHHSGVLVAVVDMVYFIHSPSQLLEQKETRNYAQLQNRPNSRNHYLHTLVCTIMYCQMHDSSSLLVHNHGSYFVHNLLACVPVRISKTSVYNNHFGPDILKCLVH